MTFDLQAHAIQALLLDIEGATTPVSFVTDVLFPFARRELRQYLRDELDATDLREPLRLLHEEWRKDRESGNAPPQWQADDRGRRIESIAAYAEWLMDRDRKATGLKALQGRIWSRGYERGLLRGEVFPDVPVAFTRWRAKGIRIAIFSSGSVLAQQLLFRTTRFGDLTACIDAFFDTTVGAKISADSYRRIASQLACPAVRILFVSDSAGELEAAQEAGCQVLMCVRPGHSATPGEIGVVRDFGAIL